MPQRSWSVGDAVAVWSRSASAWGHGSVEEINGKMVTVEFFLPSGNGQGATKKATKELRADDPDLQRVDAAAGMQPGEPFQPQTEPPDTIVNAIVKTKETLTTTAAPTTTATTAAPTATSSPKTIPGPNTTDNTPYELQVDTCDAPLVQGVPNATQDLERAQNELAPLQSQFETVSPRINTSTATPVATVASQGAPMPVGVSAYTAASAQAKPMASAHAAPTIATRYTTQTSEYRAAAPTLASADISNMPSSSLPSTGPNATSSQMNRQPVSVNAPLQLNPQMGQACPVIAARPASGPRYLPVISSAVTATTPVGSLQAVSTVSEAQSLLMQTTELESKLEAAQAQAKDEKAKRQAEEAHRLRVEGEVRQQAEEVARLQAKLEAKRTAEEEVQRRTVEDVRRRQIEAEAKLKALEEVYTQVSTVTTEVIPRSGGTTGTGGYTVNGVALEQRKDANHTSPQEPWVLPISGRVQIFSRTLKSFVPGEVKGVALQQGTDKHNTTIIVGSLQVEYGYGSQCVTKWITPEDFKMNLKTTASMEQLCLPVSGRAKVFSQTIQSLVDGEVAGVALQTNVANGQFVLAGSVLVKYIRSGQSLTRWTPPEQLSSLIKRP